MHSVETVRDGDIVAYSHRNYIHSILEFSVWIVKIQSHTQLLQIITNGLTFISNIYFSSCCQQFKTTPKHIHLYPLNSIHTHATCNDDNNNNKQKHNSFGVIVIILFYFTSFRLSTQNTVFLVLPIFICTQ